MREIEARRLAEQARLDGLKSGAERNRLGQFATPPDLAFEIARHVRGIRGPGPQVRFLDPTVGSGAFYAALRLAFGSHEVESALGIELDPAFADAAHRLWSPSGLRVVRGSFFDQPPESPRPNLILANPPYVRHHHIPLEDKQRLRRLVSERLGLEVSGLAGLYLYILLAADAWLDDGGLAAWLIPSEFMDVNYGEALRRYLTERVSLIRVHRAEPSDAQFGDALVTSAVVVFRKAPPAPGHRARMTLGGTLDEPGRSEEVPLEQLRAARKWTGFPGETSDRTLPDGPTLGDLFAIRRGIATGANRFFILPRDRARALGIPDGCLRPILPGPRSLTSTTIEADPDGYPRLDPALALIDCDRPLDDLRREAPGLWAYLESGRQAGIDRGYLASRRTPWYVQERREPSPFVCNYMGRPGRRGVPFTFYWNRSRAIAPNVYLMLYPRGPIADRPDLHPDLFRQIQGLNPSSIVGEGRVYGGGLHKLEPRELARIPLGAAIADRFL